jgi:hypothetical protein
MTAPLELSWWIEKAVRGLREEDQQTYRARFMDQWRQHYEGFLASGKSEGESRSLALALMGNAREARARLKRTLITQAEQDLLDSLKWPDSGTEPFRMSRKETLTVLSVSFILSLPVWFVVPLSVLLKSAFFLCAIGCAFTGICALMMCMRVCEKWIREKYSLQRLLVWRAVILPFMLASVFWMGSVACEWCTRSTDPASDGVGNLVINIQFLVMWLVEVIPVVRRHLSVARKLSRLESNQPPSLPAQAHPAL